MIIDRTGADSRFRCFAIVSLSQFGSQRVLQTSDRSAITGMDVSRADLVLAGDESGILHSRDLRMRSASARQLPQSRAPCWDAASVLVFRCASLGPCVPVARRR